MVLDHLASGGMASVHLGRLRGEAGFRRLVAIKILHAQLARDPEVRAMFMQEARIVSGIRHRHVVQTLDVLEDQGDLFLVMDYVDGVPVSRVMKDVLGAGGSVPVPIAVALICDMLEGLHAAHEARDDDGRPRGVVHRDVSPQNVMIARDGSALVVDFGIARAADRGHLTTPGQIKGKAAYMAPEQARGEAIDRRVDLYAAAVIGWELLTGERLFAEGSFAQTILQQLEKKPDPPSARREGVSPELDAALLRGLAKNREARFATAREMVAALEASSRRASRAEVSEYVVGALAEFFRERDAMVTRVSREPDEAEPANALSSATSDGEADTRIETRRRRRAALFVIAAAVLTALGLGTVALAMHHPAPVVAAPSAFAPPAGSGAPVDAGEPEPAPDAVAAVVVAERVDAAVAAVVLPVHSTRHGHASAPPPPPPEVAPPPPPDLPACCASGIRLHFRDCKDNCPTDPAGR